MFDLEKHRYMFGKPGEGVHKHRFLGVAIVDVVATLLVAVVVAFSASFRTNRPLLPIMAVSIFLFFLFGVVMHRVFGAKTAVDKLLFGNS